MFWMPALLALAAVAVGCGSGTEPDPVGLAQEFTLAAGESVRIRGETLGVAFDSVSADSRCPVDVTCVWEGDAVVVVTLTDPARQPATVELHTSGRFAQAAGYGDFEVTLVKLAPEPKAGNPIPQSAYRATLRVTR